MFDLLRKHNRLNETLFLFTISIISFLISIIRFYYIGLDPKTFHFLNWNLFLASIPWILTSFVIVRPSIQKNKILLIVLWFVWLLFFPNSLYIFTDLYHLTLQSPLPIWYHMILILLYAWTGMLFGILSLWDLEKILSIKLNRLQVKIVSVVLLLLGSFGIYLGRYLRWNSWDIISKPLQLMYDISERVIYPFAHLRTWGMTLMMWVLLNIIYWSLEMIRKRG